MSASWIDDWFTEDERATRGSTVAVAIEKHKGPGNHPNGSPQAVHAGGGGGGKVGKDGRLDVGMKGDGTHAQFILDEKMTRNGITPQVRSRLKNRVITDLANYAAEHAGLTEDERAFLIQNREVVIERAITQSRNVQALRWNDEAHLFDVLADEGISLSKQDLEIGWTDSTALAKKTAMGLSDNGILRLALYSEANNFVKTWANTALDHNEQARYTQQIANDLFPGEHRAFDRFISTGRDTGYFDTSIPSLDQKLRTAFLQRTYDQTQAFLADVPGTHVTLFRGFTGPEGMGGWSEISANPLSSWTTDRGTAKDFGLSSSMGEMDGYVLEASIPKEWIVSTPYTGLGALHEAEVIVNLPDGHQVHWMSERYFP